MSLTSDRQTDTSCSCIYMHSHIRQTDTSCECKCTLTSDRQIPHCKCTLTSGCCNGPTPAVSSFVASLVAQRSATEGAALYGTAGPCLHRTARKGRHIACLCKIKTCIWRRVRTTSETHPSVNLRIQVRNMTQSSRLRQWPFTWHGRSRVLIDQRTNTYRRKSKAKRVYRAFWAAKTRRGRIPS